MMQSFWHKIMDEGDDDELSFIKAVRIMEKIKGANIQRSVRPDAVGLFGTQFKENVCLHKGSQILEAIKDGGVDGMGTMEVIASNIFRFMLDKVLVIDAEDLEWMGLDGNKFPTDELDKLCNKISGKQSKADWQAAYIKSVMGVLSAWMQGMESVLSEFDSKDGEWQWQLYHAKETMACMFDFVIMLGAHERCSTRSDLMSLDTIRIMDAVDMAMNRFSEMVDVLMPHGLDIEFDGIMSVIKVTESANDWIYLGGSLFDLIYIMHRAKVRWYKRVLENNTWGIGPEEVEAMRAFVAEYETEEV